MDMALVAAESLLQSADDALRNNTYTKLKDLKSQWEETSTYITHCHRCCSAQYSLIYCRSRQLFSVCTVCSVPPYSWLVWPEGYI